MDKNRATKPPTYSLVVPIYNEEAVIPILLRRLDALLDSLDAPGEAIFVDDGSEDTSAIVLEGKARADRRYRLVKLSRNFGHQIAITAGLDHAAGRAVVVMDADLQDPPEVVHAMIARWKEGYDVVCAERASRRGESGFRRMTADLFYRLAGALCEAPIRRNVGDFRLIDRKALDCFLAMPERDRFVRGMFAWIGFRQGSVSFDRPPRAADETKYSLRRMIVLAANGLVSFSDAPLRLALWAGAAVSRARARLRARRDRSLGVRRPEPRARLELDHCRRRRTRGREHADDRRYRALRRAHSCGGEAPAALHRRARRRLRARAGERAPAGAR
jgi:glycosyltransferase involved in cell wall biosynthesis